MEFRQCSGSPASTSRSHSLQVTLLCLFLLQSNCISLRLRALFPLLSVIYVHTHMGWSVFLPYLLHSLYDYIS